MCDSREDEEREKERGKERRWRDREIDGDEYYYLLSKIYYLYTSSLYLIHSKILPLFCSYLLIHPFLSTLVLNFPPISSPSHRPIIALCCYYKLLNSLYCTFSTPPSLPLHQFPSPHLPTAYHTPASLSCVSRH